MVLSGQLSVADSDDDEDNVILGVDINLDSTQQKGADPYQPGSTTNRDTTCPSERGSLPTIPPVDLVGKDDAVRRTSRSTGSTERLRKEIAHAEQRLFASIDGSTTTELARSVESTSDRGAHDNTIPPNMACSMTLDRSFPAETRLDRRWTTDISLNHETDRSAKRESVVKRMSSTNNFLVSDANSFPNISGISSIPDLNLKNADTRSHTSSAPKDNPWRDDFARHQPAPLFRDTGSTVVENESSQMRMFERAVNEAREGPFVHDTELMPTSQNRMPEQEASRSSSLIWTPSEQVCTQTYTQDTTARKSNFIPVSESMEQKSVPSSDAMTLENPTPPHLSERQRSPIVCVPLGVHNTGEFEVATTVVTAPCSPVEPDEAKRKKEDGNVDSPQQEDTWKDDDGLPPAELYKPRLSKRRATQPATPVLDFSIRPEKASRTRRIKTTEVSLAQPESLRKASDQGDIAKTGVLNDNECKTGTAFSPSQVDTPSISEHEGNGHAVDTVSTKDDIIMSETQPALHTPLADDTIEIVEVKPTTKAHLKVPSREKDDLIANGPKPHISGKVRRSHTTIFEDHVEFVGSDKVLSLNEQQAKRKRAVKKSSRTNDTKRRRVVAVDSSDDDEEDELAGGLITRGIKDSHIHLTTSTTFEVTNEKDGQPIAATEKLIAEDLPSVKSKRRGRPPKSQTSQGAELSKLAKENDHIGTGLHQDTAPPEPLVVIRMNEIVPEVTKDAEPNAEQGKNDSSKSLETSANQAETTDDIVAQDGAEKVSSSPNHTRGPLQHSPIRHSSPVPYRVGLSRRQRIPSLLRVVRPTSATATNKR